MASKVESTLKRKIGPAPAWVWVVSAVVLYYLYRHFKGSSAATGASSVTPVTSNAQGQPVSSGGGASGGGSPVDQASADQLSAGINSDLTAALINSQNGILGLGAQALGYNGQLEQSIIDSYFPSVYSASTPIGSAGGSSFGVAGPTTYADPYAGVSRGGGERVTWYGNPPAAVVPQPVTPTQLLPAGGFGRPHTVTGGF
jgi:hypothetical protein